MGLSAGAAQSSAQALFPEQNLLASPESFGLAHPGHDRVDRDFVVFRHDAVRIASRAEARERAERMQIEEAIRQTEGEIRKTATLLGISRPTVWKKMRLFISRDGELKWGEMNAPTARGILRRQFRRPGPFWPDDD